MEPNDIEQEGQSSRGRLQSLAIICTIPMVAIAPYAILFSLRVPLYGSTRVFYFFNALVILPFLTVFGIVCSFQLLQRNVWRMFAIVLWIISVGICTFVLWEWIRFELVIWGRVVVPQPWKAMLGGIAFAFVTFLVATRFAARYKRKLFVQVVLPYFCFCLAISAYHAFQFLPRFLERGEELVALKRYPAEEMVDTPAPAFSLRTIQGSTYDLESNGGKVILLNFWATWCGPCIAEMPYLERVYQELRDNRTTVLAVSVDQDTSKVKPFIDSLHYSFTTLYGNRQLNELYHLQGIPTTFLIDKKGIIREVQIGYAEGALPRLKNLMQRYLDE